MSSENNISACGNAEHAVVDHDYHTHSLYSDGHFLRGMVEAASEAGLEGVGIADHCIISDRPEMLETRTELGFNLDRTYGRRRAAIERFREQFEIEIYDAVEMDYDPRDEDAIAAFLSQGNFQYAIGSIHQVDGVNIQDEASFSDTSQAERAAVVDDYFENLLALVESELFEIAGHLDLIERNQALRGFATESQYRQVAEALARSRTIVELNAGRILATDGTYHPKPSFLAVLREYDIPITVGTDSHTPEALIDRTPHIATRLDTLGIEPTELSL